MPSTFMRIGENAAVCWALCCEGFHFKSPFFPWAQWENMTFDQFLSLFVLLRCFLPLLFSKCLLTQQLQSLSNLAAKCLTKCLFLFVIHLLYVQYIQVFCFIYTLNCRSRLYCDLGRHI